MEQARNYVCTECASAVPSGHKFCGACGATVPTEAQTLETQFFGAMQKPGKARLIVVRGDDAMGEGLSYLLQATAHVAGREADQIPFPSDNWLSPKHANFLYRGDKLVVRDEGSLNGVYLRIRGTAPLQIGDYFSCGQQVFRVDATPKDSSGPEADQTHFYSSPRLPSAFRITQILEGGMDGIVCSPQELELVRAEFGRGFLVVTPGIRPRWAAAQDQKRIMTPADALAGGADYLVIGRPIIAAPSPGEAFLKIRRELDGADADAHGKNGA